MGPVTDLTTALFTGISAAFIALLAALPAILGALILLVLGWIISGAVAGLVERALRLARVDVAAERSGIQSMLQRAQVHSDVPHIIAGFVKWYARLVFILMAAEAVHITAIATVVNMVLGFIPNLLVALVILGAFAWLAGVARKASLGALEGAGVSNASAISMLAYVACFGFGVVAAATQIGVATTLIDIMFAGLVGAVALAFGLAFGLGGREEAAGIWRNLRSQTSNISSGAKRTPTPVPSGSMERTSTNGKQVPTEPTYTR
jgi:hypothetical protein